MCYKYGPRKSWLQDAIGLRMIIGQVQNDGYDSLCYRDRIGPGTPGESKSVIAQGTQVTFMSHPTGLNKRKTRALTIEPFQLSLTRFSNTKRAKS